MRKFLILACLLAAAVSCGTTKVREYKVKVVREYPHDVVPATGCGYGPRACKTEYTDR
jgi:glutamine cyclotransferase